MTTPYDAAAWGWNCVPGRYANPQNLHHEGFPMAKLRASGLFTFVPWRGRKVGKLGKFSYKCDENHRHFVQLRIAWPPNGCLSLILVIFSQSSVRSHAPCGWPASRLPPATVQNGPTQMRALTPSPKSSFQPIGKQHPLRRSGSQVSGSELSQTRINACCKWRVGAVAEYAKRKSSRGGGAK